MRCEFCGQNRTDVEVRNYVNRITFLSCTPCVRNIELEAEILTDKLVANIRDDISNRIQIDADERIKK